MSLLHRQSKSKRQSWCLLRLKRLSRKTSLMLKMLVLQLLKIMGRLARDFAEKKFQKMTSLMRLLVGCEKPPGRMKKFHPRNWHRWTHHPASVFQKFGTQLHWKVKTKGLICLRKVSTSSLKLKMWSHTKKKVKALRMKVLVALLSIAMWRMSRTNLQCHFCFQQSRCHLR